jgi:hypothetical protein
LLNLNELKKKDWKVLRYKNERKLKAVYINRFKSSVGFPSYKFINPKKTGPQRNP